MEAICKARERRRKHFVPSRPKRASDALPAPTAMPCTVDKYECRHETLSSDGIVNSPESALSFSSDMGLMG